MATEIVLGTKVRFSIFLKRSWVEARRENFSGHYQNKVWFPTEGPIREGLVIGKRTLSNGLREWDEDGVSYQPGEFLPAYLVVFDLRRAPVPVRPEDLEIIDG